MQGAVIVFAVLLERRRHSCCDNVDGDVVVVERRKEGKQTREEKVPKKWEAPSLDASMEGDIVTSVHDTNAASTPTRGIDDLTTKASALSTIDVSRWFGGGTYRRKALHYTQVPPSEYGKCEILVRRLCAREDVVDSLDSENCLMLTIWESRESMTKGISSSFHLVEPIDVFEALVQ